MSYFCAPSGTCGSRGRVREVPDVFSALHAGWARLTEDRDIIWRGVRVVEGARLESVYTRKGIAGSNPALSALRHKSKFTLLVPFLFSCNSLSIR